MNIRELDGYTEYRRCHDLQKLIWGKDFAEAVAPAILMVAHRTGGIAAGAFLDDGTLAGFVFGITGFVDGAPLHWSDMLGVHPGCRGRGIGLALKRYQRTALLGRGVTRVHWTFDPLEARNAYINLNRLGATARTYIRDCYGDSDSPLHAGMPTDRLLIDWQLDSAAVQGRMERASARNHAEDARDADRDDVAEIRVPADIQQVRVRDMAEARRWRETTRREFEEWFERGYAATSLLPAEPGYSRYVLVRQLDAGS